jgi:uncharacterized membrane protein YcgQ (UPF0703/DUF1980 family)
MCRISLHLTLDAKRFAMLYSHNQENDKLQQFTIFLDHALKGDSRYTSIVNDVILEAHKYTTGLKNLYNIKRDLMNIILLLSDTDKNYFEQLQDNPEEYNSQTYSKVKDIIQQQK